MQEVLNRAEMILATLGENSTIFRTIQDISLEEFLAENPLLIDPQDLKKKVTIVGTQDIKMEDLLAEHPLLIKPLNWLLVDSIKFSLQI